MSAVADVLNVLDVEDVAELDGNCEEDAFVPESDADCEPMLDTLPLDVAVVSKVIAAVAVAPEWESVREAVPVLASEAEAVVEEEARSAEPDSLGEGEPVLLK